MRTIEIEEEVFDRLIVADLKEALAGINEQVCDRPAELIAAFKKVINFYAVPSEKV